jgi:RimJ/RimL family protein N-acetyltransferase
VTVRPIEPDDADGFIAVFESVAGEGKWIGTELPVDAERHTRWRAFAEQPSEDLFTNVAVDGERVVGFSHIYLNRGRADLGMALLADYRGRGIGGRLLDGCIEWARMRGAHKIELEVWPHNTAARRLYERSGFVVEGRRRRRWRRNSGALWDSIEMSLVLDETSPGSPFSEE